MLDDDPDPKCSPSTSIPEPPESLHKMAGADDHQQSKHVTKAVAINGETVGGDLPHFLHSNRAANRDHDE